MCTVCIGVVGFEPNYQKIYTCLGQLLRGQPLPPLFPSGKSWGGGGGGGLQNVQCQLLAIRF